MDGIRELHTVEFKQDNLNTINEMHLLDLLLGNNTYQLALTPLEMNPIIQLEYNNHTRIHKNAFKVFDVWVLQHSKQVGIGRIAQTKSVIEGRIILNDASYVIYHVDNYRKIKKKEDVYPRHFDGFIAYKEEDLVDFSNTSSCGSNDLPHNRQLTKNKLNRNLIKRDVPVGCPQDKKVVYVGAATDCTYARFLDNDESKIIQQLISNFASASAIFERTFNVGLGLFKVNVKMECGPSTDNAQWNQLCSNNYDITQRLSDFSAWRAASGGSDAGLWHLITTCPSGSTVGVAWLSQVCQTELVSQTVDGELQQVSGAGVSSATSRDQYQVIAHEIGHNFGAIHDCTARDCGSSSQSCCPCNDQCDCDGKYIMNPTATVKSSDFSPCSVKDVCTTLSNNGKCLLPINSKPLLQNKVCGNGIQEEGEECDCGDQCDTDKCCTSECKLKPQAKCSDKNQSCCNNCQFKAANSVCRKAINGQCDKEETCDGNSGDCPKDIHTDDGTSCSIDNMDGQCASGYCTSRTIQCKARSQRNNLNGACPNSQSNCDLMCWSDQYDACIILTGSFIDGTTCGYKGFCREGTCEYSNGFDRIIGYFTDNVYIGIGLLILLIILVLGCCCSLFRRLNHKMKFRRQDSRYDQGYAMSTVQQE